jgi:hypothetical protein
MGRLDPRAQRRGGLALGGRRHGVLSVLSVSNRHEPSVFWVKPSDLVVAMIGAAVAAK